MAYPEKEDRNHMIWLDYYHPEDAPMSMKDIAEKYGISQQRVSKILRRMKKQLTAEKKN